MPNTEGGRKRCASARGVWYGDFGGSTFGERRGKAVQFGELMMVYYVFGFSMTWWSCHSVIVFTNKARYIITS